MTAVEKQIAIINKIFFTLFLFFSKSIIPKPELTNNPANNAPNGIASSRNSSVISKLDEQFGIKPTIEQYNGDRYLLDLIKL